MSESEILKTGYFFNLSESGVFAEIYFPKRAAYYGAIFDALRVGYDENKVKRYLRDNIKSLIDEFKVFNDLFNPKRYATAKLKYVSVSIEEALERINMYESSFKGWSTYSVDGVWFDSKGEPIEEATQVVRLMFRFESSFTKEAIANESLAVLRSIIFYVMSQKGRLEYHKAWSNKQRRKYLEEHDFWAYKKRSFAQQYFTQIAAEVGKWLDDRILFIFGYLVRKFWKKVLEEELREDEIWITSFYDLVLNVVKKN